MNLDDDEIDQKVWKAARELAKRSVATLGHRPDNVDSYVAGAAKAKREQHRSDLRKLIRDGLDPVAAADQIEADDNAGLDDILGRFKSSAKARTADPTVPTGEAQRRRMADETRRRREATERFPEPNEDELKRVREIIRAIREKIRTPLAPGAAQKRVAK